MVSMHGEEEDTPQAIDAVLNEALDHAPDADAITLDYLLHRLGPRGFGVLILLLSAPMALPLPALGIAQILALPLFFLAWQLLQGRKEPWLPPRLLSRRLPAASLRKVTDALGKALGYAGPFFRPRLAALTGPKGERIIGFFALLATCCVMVPLPLTNTIPSAGMFLMALGLIERDGLAVLAGMAVALAGLAVTAGILLLGMEGFRQLMAAL